MNQKIRSLCFFYVILASFFSLKSFAAEESLLRAFDLEKVRDFDPFKDESLEENEEDYIDPDHPFAKFLLWIKFDAAPIQINTKALYRHIITEKRQYIGKEGIYKIGYEESRLRHWHEGVEKYPSLTMETWGKEKKVFLELFGSLVFKKKSVLKSEEASKFEELSDKAFYFLTFEDLLSCGLVHKGIDYRAAKNLLTVASFYTDSPQLIRYSSSFVSTMEQHFVVHESLRGVKHALTKYIALSGRGIYNTDKISYVPLVSILVDPSTTTTPVLTIAYNLVPDLFERPTEKSESKKKESKKPEKTKAKKNKDAEVFTFYHSDPKAI